nr:Hsp70 family protein [Micromonospora sp. DSM 115978]
PKDDIEQMVRDAEQYAEEDHKRREEAETRNQAESLVYTTERFLAENGDKVEATVKADVEEKLGVLRAAVGGTDIAAMREATAELAKASSAMGQAMYAQAGEAAGAGAPGGATTTDDDVVDAEIVDEEDKK